MSFFNSINISATGLSAERLRMDVISKNIANAQTTKTANGGPYRRQVVTFGTNSKNIPFSRYLNEAAKKNLKLKGVEATGIKEDQSPFKEVYDPGHPDSNAEGYVLMPNVDIITEMSNMITAARAYEANITAMNSTKSMAMKALELGR